MPGVFHEVPDGHKHLNSDVVQPRLTIERYGTKQETAIKIKHTKISSKQELKNQHKVSDNGYWRRKRASFWE